MIEITATKCEDGRVLVLNIENCKTHSELIESYTNVEHIHFYGKGVVYYDEFSNYKYLMIGCKYESEIFKKKVELISGMEKKLKKFKTM